MPPRRGTPALLDRALVLAVAEAERDGAAWLDERPETPHDAEHDEDAVLVARARTIAERTGIDAPVRHGLDAQRLLWPAAGVIGLLAGLSAAWAGLAGGGDPTSVRGSALNVLWFLQITLGVHTLFFLLSLAAMAFAIGGARHPLLRVARSAAAAAGRLAGTGRAGAGARAAAAVAFGGRRGAFIAGALGHTMGFGFIAGCLIALLTAASFREQYRFFWKSTLLTDGQATALVDAIASGPRAVGFPAPSADEIAAARAGVRAEADGPEGETSRWVWLLMGALLVWGAGPRLLALGACLGGASVASARAPLPISESYRRRALARMQRPSSPPGERSGSAGAPMHGLAPPPPHQDDRPLGPPALLAYEIDADGAWPPRGLPACDDLGLVDGASDRRRVLERLDGAPTRPSAVVAFFSRGETPAEAERRFIADLVARGGERTAVVLTLSRALSTERDGRDAERIAQRTALWREASQRAGVSPSRIAEVDLHHITDSSAARLRGLVRDHGAGAPATRLAEIGRALDDIDAWARGSDHGEQPLSALLASIGTRFSAEPRWRRSARSIASGDLDQARSLVVESARSIARILPPWMPRHPGWMSAAAALATTGTLAAVAIAGGPIGVAAGAWPLYAAAGAAIGELCGRGAGALTPEPPRDEDAAARGARAAVLHALVLALQGMPDAQIAHAIDRMLSDAPDVRRASDVPALTAHVRARSTDPLAGAEGAA